MLVRSLLVVLLALVASPAAARAAEPDDTPAGATGPLAGGQSVEGVIGTDDPADHVYLNTAGARAIEVTATGLAAGCGELSLLDEEGTGVAASITILRDVARKLSYTTAASAQLVLRVEGAAGCRYRLRADPAAAVTASAPGVVVRLFDAAGDDDVQRVFVDGVLAGEVRGRNGTALSLGALPATARLTLQAESTTGRWSWNARITNTEGRMRSVLFAEQRAGGDGTRTGVVRRVTLTPAGQVAEDCGEATALVPCFDADRDGVSAPGDCDDANAAIGPAAAEVAGNAADENCDGVVSHLRVPARPALIVKLLRGGDTQVRSLVVRRVGGPFKVRVACLGRGCRQRVNGTFRARTRRTALYLTSRARFMRLRPRTILRIGVEAPGYETRVVTYRMRKGRRPAVTARCQAPGSTRLTRC